MDKIEIEKKDQDQNKAGYKISSIDFYTVLLVVLELYLLNLSLNSLIKYLDIYLSGKFLISHVVAFLNGFNLFLLFVNLIGIGMILNSESYVDKKNKIVGIFNNSIFIIFLYCVIELLNARMPY